MSTLPSRIVAEFGGPHRGRMGGEFGHPGLLVLGVLLLAGVVTAIVLLARGNRHAPHLPATAALGPNGSMSPAGSAEIILSERFARGEVSVEDFVASRAALRGEWTPTRVANPVPPAPPAPAAE